jgi:ABC-2 type transport system permease protein
MIQCGISIMDLLQEKESSQQLDRVLQSITADVFSGYKGFFQSVLKYTYLYIPLLTMGIVSRELSNGSIKLLQSSPVTNFQIIVGKYLALLGFGLYFVLVLVGIAFTASMLIENFDWGTIVAGIAGIYLLIGAYAAIGLFMSSLTSYQVVAAISTLAIFAGLNFIGEIGKGNELIREITYWLSLQGRTDHFINGMLSSQNVSYFLLVIILFLGLSIMRLDDGRVIRNQAQKSIRYISFIAVVLAVGFVTSMPRNWYFWDLSRFEANTLTASSKEVISNLDQKIHVKNYVNILHPHGRLGTPKWRKFDLKQFDQYTRYIPDIEMEYIYFYDHVPMYADSSVNIKEKAQKAAIAHGVEMDQILAPMEIKKIANLASENNAYVRFVHHGKDSVVLRMFMDAVGYPLESEITSALKRLYTKVPVVGFLQKYDERSIFTKGDKSYNKTTTDIQARSALVNNGFDVIAVNISELKDATNRLAVLVIADPYAAYSVEEKNIIQGFIRQGGNVLIAGEPGKVDLLNPLLAELPIRLKSNQIYQKSKDVEATVLAAKPSTKAQGLGLVKNRSSIISLAGVAGLELVQNSNGFKIDSILVSDTKNVWQGRIAIDTTSDSYDRETHVLAASLTRTVNDKEQRIMVLGDADFMSNSELSRFNLRTVNADFAINLFKWFTYDQFPVNTERPASIDNKILVNASALKKIKYTWTGILPVLIALTGGYLLIRRKRK